MGTLHLPSNDVKQMSETCPISLLDILELVLSIRLSLCPFLHLLKCLNNRLDCPAVSRQTSGRMTRAHPTASAWMARATKVLSRNLSKGRV